MALWPYSRGSQRCLRPSGSGRCCPSLPHKDNHSRTDVSSLPPLYFLQSSVVGYFACGELSTQQLTTTNRILCSILDLAAIGVLYTFPGWHEEEDSKGSERDVKPFPARSLSYLTLTFFFSCCGGLYIAIAWQHIAVAAAAVGVEGLRYGLVKVSVGYASIVLSWFSVFLSFVCFFGILVMILSIRVLSEMKE